MNNKQIKGLNLCLLSIELKLTALEKALTADQRITYEASLRESMDLVQNDKLSISLSPEERLMMLKFLEPKQSSI